ncbi:hypothetical protein K469DRAFT_382450 [Zopfia rhizophila CBS 207.26]|uniref:Gcp-like domain-containing protein n=1 Tax=Zopfia rhizophila CBS 207.26 TaxID=1314779 RepID=A0A6A6DBR3_9PEZI|nr:hypothetical protein K469DRAFT_382450 [Zopfia rhizophila CBS 207.26]
MRIRPMVLNAHGSRFIARSPPRRSLLTLAIETSCDDTSVAVLEKKACQPDGRTSATLHFHKKITSNNTTYQGVHPLVSLQSHQENLAKLVEEAIQHLPAEKIVKGEAYNGRLIAFPARDGGSRTITRKRPDFISVTRGPGMRSNLFTGLDTAKGLALAWQIDLVGVHHMQAHALTPHLVTALQNSKSLDTSPAQKTLDANIVSSSADIEPKFPFLSVLASGGHTLLMHSATLTDHNVLATTNDIAIGEYLDKIARAVLPPEVLKTAQSTMYGALLEEFAFPEIMAGPKKKSVPEIELVKARTTDQYKLEDSTAGEYRAIYGTRTEYGYIVPKNNQDALKQHTTKWGWGFHQPLSKAAGGLKHKSLEMSFSGLMTAVERVVRFHMDQSTGRLSKTERAAEAVTIEERRAIAREGMRAAFEHLASRVVLGLQQVSVKSLGSVPVATVVMSGGVAANRFLRYILASILTAHGYPNVRIIFPPASLCTDNAAMIAWAGLEMYQAGYSDPFTIRSVRKWPLDELLSPPKDD